MFYLYLFWFSESLMASPTNGATFYLVFFGWFLLNPFCTYTNTERTHARTLCVLVRPKSKPKLLAPVFHSLNIKIDKNTPRVKLDTHTQTRPNHCGIILQVSLCVCVLRWMRKRNGEKNYRWHAGHERGDIKLMIPNQIKFTLAGHPFYQHYWPELYK